MASTISADDIIHRTSTGIQKAQEDYEYWSGGRWLWEAHEYLATVYIAREISKIRGSYYLTLEDNVRATIRDAGHLRRGRPPKDLRLKGRFDIVVWWAKGTPRAVIEVKSQPAGFSSVKDDVARICSTLKADTDIRFGLMAYYISFDSGHRKQAEHRLSDRVEGIAEDARQFARGKGMKLKRHRGPVIAADCSAWAAEVLKISR